MKFVGNTLYLLSFEYLKVGYVTFTLRFWNEIFPFLSNEKKSKKEMKTYKNSLRVASGIG